MHVAYFNKQTPLFWNNNSFYLDKNCLKIQGINLINLSKQ